MIRDDNRERWWHGWAGKTGTFEMHCRKHCIVWSTCNATTMHNKHHPEFNQKLFRLLTSTNYDTLFFFKFLTLCDILFLFNEILWLLTLFWPLKFVAKLKPSIHTLTLLKLKWYEFSSNFHFPPNTNFITRN